MPTGGMTPLPTPSFPSGACFGLGEGLCISCLSPVLTPLRDPGEGALSPLSDRGSPGQRGLQGPLQGSTDSGSKISQAGLSRCLRYDGVGACAQVSSLLGGTGMVPSL